MKKNILFLLLFYLVSACESNFLPKAIGEAYEVYIVLKGSSLKEDLQNVFREEVPCLPQREPVMDVKIIDYKNFTGFLRNARNVLYVEVDSLYRKVSILERKDVWARGQQVLFLQIPNEESLRTFLSERMYREQIIKAFDNAEKWRLQEKYRKSFNKEATQYLKKEFSLSLFVPDFINQVQKGRNFFWATSKGEPFIAMVVYKIPYNRKEMPENSQLISVRDSVMRKNIRGVREDCYMQTFSSSVCFERWNKGDNSPVPCVKWRGLWDMKNDMMGGCFVCVSYVDEKEASLITVEGFVYAPSKKKRNLLKMAEAFLPF